MISPIRIEYWPHDLEEGESREIECLDCDVLYLADGVRINQDEWEIGHNEKCPRCGGRNWQ